MWAYCVGDVICLVYCLRMISFACGCVSCCGVYVGDGCVRFCGFMDCLKYFHFVLLVLGLYYWLSFVGCAPLFVGI